MRFLLNLLILAAASAGLGAVVAPHVPAVVAGVLGILSVMFAAALIGAGLIAERKA